MLSYSERAKESNNPTGKRLFELMEKKKTNLAIAADVTTKAELLRIAKELGPDICILKTHIDIIEDFDADLIDQLKKFSQEHNFLLFEDRKFADIGNTVKMQYEKGIYKIAEWADITNAHVVPGPGVIEGLQEIGLPKGRGLFLLAEMTPQGNLAKGDYTKQALEWAKEYKDYVIGFITTRKLLDDPAFINYTPAIKLETGTDKLGQQYNTPQLALVENDSDIISVGRGIYTKDDIKAEAAKYREAGWQAYQQKLKI